MYIYHQLNGYSLLGVVFLLGQAIGRDKTFCSHPDVVRTLTNPPTPFCSLSGSKPHSCKFTCTHKCALACGHTHAMSCMHRLTHIHTHYYALKCSHNTSTQAHIDAFPLYILTGFVFQFTVGVLTGCWLAQLTYMVILLYFPFFGERTLKKKKKLYHAVSLVAIITLSLISPVVALAKFNYVTIWFPPLMCFPRSQDWVFYSMVLPLSILVAIGVILCILLIRAIHKVSVLIDCCLSVCTSGHRVVYTEQQVCLECGVINWLCTMSNNRN